MYICFIFLHVFSCRNSIVFIQLLAKLNHFVSVCLPFKNLFFQNRFSLLGAVQFSSCQHLIKKPTQNDAYIVFILISLALREIFHNRQNFGHTLHSYPFVKLVPILLYNFYTHVHQYYLCTATSVMRIKFIVIVLVAWVYYLHYIV